MRIEDAQLGQVLEEISNLRKEMTQNEYYNRVVTGGDLAEIFEKFKTRISLFSQVKDAELILEQHSSIVLRDELRSMKRVLQRLGFVDRNNVVLDKGKMACEISSCDELILTEMVFNNIFDGMSAQYIIAMCSCLVLRILMSAVSMRSKR
jgi:ATP-dependent RNA helicase DOB1